jgi:hypothetical protein
VVDSSFSNPHSKFKYAGTERQIRVTATIPTAIIDGVDRIHLDPNFSKSELTQSTEKN